MYRCYFCKDPVGITEHMRMLGTYGEFFELDDTEADKDCYDPNGAMVICGNCIKDVEIEIES